MMSTHSGDGRTDPKQAQLDAQRVEHDQTALTTDQGVKVEHTDDSVTAVSAGPR